MNQDKMSEFNLLYQEIISLNKDREEINISFPPHFFIEIALLLHHKAFLLQVIDKVKDNNYSLYHIEENVSTGIKPIFKQHYREYSIMKITTKIPLISFHKSNKDNSEYELFLSELFREISIKHTELKFFIEQSLKARYQSQSINYFIDSDDNFIVTTTLD